MKLALVTHKFVNGDGQGRVNAEVARAALRRGHRVTLLAGAVDPDLQAHPQATWVPISVAGWPTEMIRNLVFARKSARWLRRHRADYDMLHVNGAITGQGGDVNAAHFVHGAWLRSPVHTARLERGAYGLYQGAYTALNARWERAAYQSSRRVVAVSAQVRRELISIGVPPERIHVIPNGVDLDEFRPGPPGDRAALGLPSGVPLALFVGDIRTPRKNLDVVLSALVHTPSLHLAVVGSRENSPYPEMARRLGVADRAHFLGFRRDIADLMRASDVFVSLAHYEPFSLVLLEAMACGLPVVTSASVGAAQLVTPQAGIVLPNADAAALADALNHLSADPGARRCLGRAARAAAEEHGWAQMADRYLALYEELAAQLP